ncbi:MAG: metallophosphoesterase [Clostridia bacterium]|nr:metallophosphoesterase [Clostridia bacterium]MDE7079998.1 metallophosphoesterase [Clostridia bacterium]
MKNIMVISDTHNRLPKSETFWEALDNVDYIFHLGDGARDIEHLKEAYPDKLVFVYGNNDCKTSNQEKTVEIEGVKFFLTHGHHYKVKSSDLNLQLRGLELGVDCCLYGHVHIPQYSEYGKMKLINPGSLTYSHTYCYMTVKDGKILHRAVNADF